VSDDRSRDIQDAWGRFGQYMEAWAGYSARVWGRQQTLWASVAKNLADKKGYDADKAVNDAVHAMAVMQRNAEDGWRVLTGPPDTQPTVSVLPTAFLFFDLSADATPQPLVEPVDIPVPATVDRDSLPEQAFIALNGTSVQAAADTDGDEDAQPEDPSIRGVQALQDSLKARLRPGRGAYRLQAVAESEEDLVRGVYDGLVYLVKPAVPLANLRIIVGPPPAV
jgi:hypothetical protein